MMLYVNKKKLYSGSKTSIKCYIKRTIDVNNQCRRYSDGNIAIISNSKDIFGNIATSTEVINIKPIQSSFCKNNIRPFSWNTSKYKYTNIINNIIFKCDSNYLWIIYRIFRINLCLQPKFDFLK